MRNRRQSAFVFVIGAFGALAVASAFDDQKPAAQEEKDKATFEAVCGACHPVGMVDGIRSEVEWKETVEQMVGIGAKGTEQQLASVMRYLLRNQTKVNVNTATAPEIAPVLGISEATAQAVTRRRKEIGGFKTIQDLEKVPGVDSAKLESRRDRIVF
jgi:competence protein ComEA